MTNRLSVLGILYFAISFGCCATLRGDDAKLNVTTVPLSEGGPLEIKAPEGWIVKAPNTDLGTTIVAGPKEGDATLRITFFPMKEELSKERIDALVKISSQQYVGGSVEKE